MLVGQHGWLRNPRCCHTAEESKIALIYKGMDQKYSLTTVFAASSLTLETAATYTIYMDYFLLDIW